MKKLILLFLVSFLIIVKINSMDIITINNIKILPDNYSSKDSIKVVLNIFTAETSVNLGYSIKIDSSQINLSACFYFTGQLGTSNFTDTIKLGILPLNDYNLTIYAYSSSTDSICIPKDTISKSIQFSITTGINEQGNNSEFSIYPNPASEKIRINYWKEGSENYKITISNLQGQAVVTKENSCFIDINGLDQGIYLLWLQDRRKIYTKKLLIN